ncbi:L,D-transpeptidase family protein [Pseudosulfitobacter koreensis]|uniref:L,D-transpeptidase family protein n=1 Tax=Pseudosulfitobacter koreensis TaxID=2968472 RepID=A0ABT1Z223_9RHOB|nr:L,D-transpeptidase family protein [Pseudosulfitobacter koreense]MCR8827168.1 L,D-transpeptidase family protein [Pseudosulfitobacter koreense]
MTLSGNRIWTVLAALATILALWSVPASAQVTAFKQAVAEAASSDKDIAAFYQSNGYDSIWTGGTSRDRDRRAALIRALETADDHGLPVSRYDPQALIAKMKSARTPRDMGLVEVEISRVFLQYARDVQTGLLVPSRVDSRIVRQVPYRDRTSYLVNFTKSSPTGFFKALPPRTHEYTALMKQKLRMERLMAEGGWGQTVPAGKLEPGQSGNAVVIMRNRLMAMGFLDRTASQSYDAKMTAAVQQFQLAHGLAVDGVAGQTTLVEMNRSVEERLQSIIVAMERERWMNKERGSRHILVNIPDFTAKVIDNGKLTFETRSVVGATNSDRPTPEFSDVMEFMVINPSWYVPRSIVTSEYLPALKRNPNAVSHIEITDSKGRRINRGAVNFNQYTERTFPFSMRQPPSKGNALGLVKFMFPNRHNIYLHDTPSKSLFDRESRAFSHGCVRLADPFDFAYTLLAKQTSDPKGLFQGKLASGNEQTVMLEQPVPVHIIYRTAFTTPKGDTQYRRDIYGRDARIWDALSQAGVALRAVQG